MPLSLINTIEGVTPRVSPSLFAIWHDALPSVEDTCRPLSSLPEWLASEKEWIEERLKETPAPGFEHKQPHLKPVINKFANETTKLQASEWGVEHVLCVWKKLHGEAAIYVLSEPKCEFKGASPKDVLVASPSLTVIIEHSKGYLDVTAFASHDADGNGTLMTAPCSHRLEELINESEESADIKEMLKRMLSAHAAIAPESGLRVRVVEFPKRQTQQMAMVMTEFLDGRPKCLRTLIKERTIHNLRAELGKKCKVYKLLKMREHFNVELVQKMRMFDEDSAAHGVTDAEMSSSSDESSDAEGEAETEGDDAEAVTTAKVESSWLHDERLMITTETKVVESVKFSAPTITRDSWETPQFYFEADLSKYLVIHDPAAVRNSKVKRKCALTRDFFWNLMQRVKTEALTSERPYVSRFIVEAFSATYDDMESKEKRLSGRLAAEKRNELWDMLLCIDSSVAPERAFQGVYARLCSYVNGPRTANSRAINLEGAAAVTGYIPALAVNFRVLKDERPFALVNLLTDMIYKIPLRSLFEDILHVKIPDNFNDGSKKDTSRGGDDEENENENVGVLSMTLEKLLPYAVLEGNEPNPRLTGDTTKTWNRFLWEICAPVCARCRHALASIRTEEDVAARCASQPTGLLCTPCYVRMGLLVYAGAFSKDTALEHVEGYNPHAAENLFDAEACQNRLNWFGFPTLQEDEKMQYTQADVKLFRKDSKHRAQVSKYLWSLLAEDCQLGECVIEHKAEQPGGKEYFAPLFSAEREVASEHLDIFENMDLVIKKDGHEERKGEDDDDEDEDEDEEEEEAAPEAAERPMEMEQPQTQIDPYASARGVTITQTQTAEDDHEVENPDDVVHLFNMPNTAVPSLQFQESSMMPNAEQYDFDPNDGFLDLLEATEPHASQANHEDTRTSDTSVTPVQNPHEMRYMQMQSQGQACPRGAWSRSRAPPTHLPAGYVDAPPMSSLSMQQHQHQQPLCAPSSPLPGLPPPPAHYEPNQDVIGATRARSSKRRASSSSHSDPSLSYQPPTTRSRR